MPLHIVDLQPPASHTSTESTNVHAGETVRVTVRNSGQAFYVTANQDEFLPFHTFGGSRDDECNTFCPSFKPSFGLYINVFMH